MKYPEIQIIQSLIENKEFQTEISELELNQAIPEGVAESFNEFERKDLEVARQIILSTNAHNNKIDCSNKDQIWNNIKSVTDKFDNDNISSNGKLSVHRRRPLWKSVMKYAAIFVGLGLAFAWGVYYDLTDKQPTEVSQSVINSNPSGQKSRIQLSDGSVVHLNAESELEYKEGFSKSQRKIHLKGEAYFEVAKDRNRPFTVITENISVTALGTEFNVNAFKQDVQVALVEGSVLVNNSKNNDQMILSPSEVLKFDSKSSTLSKASSGAEQLSVWRNRTIYFEDTPINEAIETLSRWYAVKISVEKLPTSELTVSGKFQNRSLELLLKNLSYSLNFDYNINGNNITLNFNN